MTLEDKVALFSRHILERHLRIAERLGIEFANSTDDEPLSRSGFAILSIVFSYFEMYEQFSTGISSNGASKRSFVNGFMTVMQPPLPGPIDRDTALDIYEAIRCGMFHSLFLKKRFGITRHLNIPMKAENGDLLINPAKLTEHLIQHFEILLHTATGCISSYIAS